MHAHLSSMRQRAIQSSAEATIARAELNRLMGAPIDASFSVVEPMPPPADTTSTADLLALAASNRPELAMALATERVADAEAGAARAGWLPQVAARAMAEQDGLSFGDRASSWLAGVELRWSVSLGGGEGARTRAASANLARARAEADSVKAGVDVDVITALARVQSARARIDASGAAVEQARESQRIIRNRYDAGLAAVTDVLRASTALLDAEGARVSAVADALSAAAALDRAVGRSSLSSR
jgi:outer membrane protein TolC